MLLGFLFPGKISTEFNRYARKAINQTVYNTALAYVSFALRTINITWWWCKHKLLHAICWKHDGYHECNRCKCEENFNEKFARNSTFTVTLNGIEPFEQHWSTVVFSLFVSFSLSECKHCLYSNTKQKPLKHSTFTVIASFWLKFAFYAFILTHTQRLMS